MPSTSRTRLDEAIRSQLHAYISEACRKSGCEALRVGGPSDHIHIACRMSRTISLSQLIEKIKRPSSKWIKIQKSIYQSFAWQLGYGAFSIGEAHLPRLLKYIDNQLEHHKTQTFKEEFLGYFEGFGAVINQKYLWD